ncbi:hypothetical protein OROMI_002046 [Orobanche minor]
MGESDEIKNEGERKAAEHSGEKKAAGGGEKTEVGSITVVLKLDLHCEGCAKKVRRCISHLEGVEKVKADCDSKKLTVTGNVDPAWLREKVESKTKKKVEVISPQPKKNAGGVAAACGGDNKAEEKSEKKTKEDVIITTVVMKIKLHCDGCAIKIKRIILKNIDGVTSVVTDVQKNLITVTGTMDVKKLTTHLRGKLKREVEIVFPKKNGNGGEKTKEEGEGGGSSGGDGEKKEKVIGNGVCDNEKKENKDDDGGGRGDVKGKVGGDGGGSGGKTREKVDRDGGDGGDEKNDGIDNVGKFEVNKMEHHSYDTQIYYAMPMHMHEYANEDYGISMYRHHHHHHHQQGYSNPDYVMHYADGPPLPPRPPPPPPSYLNMNDAFFSDENSNGCFVM